jgi:hypothetical protein
MALAGMSAGFSASYRPLSLARQEFWLIAECLLRYDLSLIPGNVSVPVLLHSHLMDFAAFFDRERFVRLFFALCAKRGFASGIHTQQPGEALSCLGRWRLYPKYIACLAFPNDAFTASIMQDCVQDEGLLSGSTIVSEIDSWPHDLQSGAQACTIFGGFSTGAIIANPCAKGTTEPDSPVKFS